jgi:hypothetical protein
MPIYVYDKHYVTTDTLLQRLIIIRNQTEN